MITNRLKLMIGAVAIATTAIVTVAATNKLSNLDTPTMAEVGIFKGSTSYCSWENYGVNINQLNYPGHIDNQTKEYAEGTKVYLPDNRNGFKFSSSSVNGVYTYTLTSAYNRVYVWAAGWGADTSSLDINGVSVDIEPNALVAGSLNVDIYYDRYAFTLPEAATEFTFTATKRLVIGGVAWYNDIDLSNDIIAIDGPGAPEEPPASSEVEEGGVTIQPTDFKAVTNADYSTTKEGITVTVTASTVTSDQLRVFKGQTITISSDKNITSIQFTCTANGTAKYGPGCFAAQDGYSYEAAGKKGTWTGSSKSIVFTAGTNQVRITEITVTTQSN